MSTVKREAITKLTREQMEQVATGCDDYSKSGTEEFKAKQKGLGVQLAKYKLACIGARRLCAVVLLAGALGPIQAAENGEGRSLFNGKNLSGWAPVHEVTFAVTNANLRLVTGMGWLRTTNEYSNFILELEWRALEPQYDSGIFVRAGLEGKPWPKDGWQVNLASRALGALVKGYKTVVPAETPPKPVNEWVKFRITVKGQTIALDVNGERAWEYKELDGPAKGYIGIQAENKAFDFRDLKVRELPQ